MVTLRRGDCVIVVVGDSSVEAIVAAAAPSGHELFLQFADGVPPIAGAVDHMLAVTRDGDTWREVRTGIALHVRRATPARIVRPYRVADLVRVGRPCGGNVEGDRALVVEVFDCTSVRLLFRNGYHDRFTPAACTEYAVTFDQHEPRLDGFDFAAILRLPTDRRAAWFREGEALHCAR